MLVLFWKVRLSICEEFPHLIKALSDEMQLLPELYELMSDEKSDVRLKAMEALVAALPCLSTEVIESSVLQVIKKYMQPRGLDTEMQICLAGLFGRLVLEVS